MPPTPEYKSSTSTKAYRPPAPQVIEAGHRNGSDGPGKRASTGDCSVGHWERGLFGCFSNCVPNCLMVSFCPCISLAQILSRLGWYSNAVALLLMIALWGAEQAISFALYSSTDDYRAFCNRSAETSAWSASSSSSSSTESSSSASASASASSWSSSSSASQDDRMCKITTTSYALAISLMVLQLFSLFLVVIVRRSVRNRFQIPGSCVVDWLAACCCPCCAVAQIATHVKSYTPGRCDFCAPDTLPKYE